MKKVITVIGCLFLAAILVVGILLSVPPKTLDFRGTVTEITVADHTVTFHIRQSSEVSYTVVADSKTRVRRCHKEDPEIALEEIGVGHTIEGNYRKFTKGNEAKFITVW